ncbi:Membrane protein involved in the export of O-antigen and teichoic acid [Alteribacillus persepolensis]|uniref:Membrane protein involved in the export of O-antigen and teichoic acid n=1 Tax=Alteribacillus persepolensis TaxID=568899 RepID=A0A1G8E3E1_9BACI|nr:polysaccharide biosynthesis protein [Alteribacillus persepolensis]SDH64456.1 Membrane protein involved in the export of O-antigen and teichoic acid [Alteribacillus persepolensis]
MAESKFLRGTVILSAATFLSKFLGMIYIFPFVAMVGQQGLALYQYGYQPYTILLSLATLGVPMAVSKFVSKYNALGDYRTGHRLFRSGIILMTITGFFAFLLLFFMAPVIAGWIISNPDELNGNAMSDVVFTIRMVSVALLLIPSMSVIRGYFQGFQSMGPTAVSQVVEQVVRIVFILAMAFAVLYLWDGELGTAVGFATFGAFVGGAGALTVLLYYWKKRKSFIREHVENSTEDAGITLTQMYKELILYALPLSFVGLAVPLFQMIDLFTFNNALMATGEYTQGQAETAYGTFAGSAHKLILIPVAIATAMSVTLIPTITNSFTNRDHALLERQITQTYQIILFLSIPAAAGLAVLSYPTFAVLFGLEDVEIGGHVLRYYAPAAVLFSLFSVTAAVLQGINRQRYAVLSLIIGLVVKGISAYGFLYMFGPIGGSFSTIAGFSAATAFNVWAIGRFAGFHYGILLKRTLSIIVFTLCMAAAVIIVKEGAFTMFPLTSWMNAFFVELFSVAAGVGVYFILTVKSGLAGIVLGERFSVLKKDKTREEE